MHKVTKVAFFLLITALTTLQIALSMRCIAKEGMWIPATLKAHENQMKALGLELPVDQIYNADGSGLNNAVVLFGRGCTGEIVSSKGLILTNHHCGYGTVQGLTSPDKDYFANGFFAKNSGEEIPCGGLTVTFIRSMENVTDKILSDLADTLHDAARDTTIARRIASVEKEYAIKTGMDATIKPYFEGNQYWVAITETYTDIRLVAFPPNGIGTFGGDDENWMWPRHTGDFSVFRVYAGADNRPAPYSAGNKPYNSKEFFSINVGGYKERDFTMVYGFPGTTMEYISSYELNQVYSTIDPISVAARTKKLQVWSNHMDASRDIFLKYTSKRAGVANGWKKWQGEMKGLAVNGAVEKKQEREKQFKRWAKSKNAPPYARTLLEELATEAHKADHLIFEEMHIREELYGIELIQQEAAFEKFVACFRGNFTQAQLTDTLKKLAKGMGGFYKNYDMATDKDVFIALMPMYMKKCKKMAPDYLKAAWKANHHKMNRWANDVYSHSLIASAARLDSFASAATFADSTRFLTDPAWQIYSSVATMRKEKIAPELDAYRAKKHYLNRLYLKAQMEKDTAKMFYPDANLTLRVAFGTIKGLDPDGPPKFAFKTTLKDVVALDDSTSLSFKVPQKLKSLYAARDFGRWGVKGDVPVAFVAENHTSGGNSGSPVLNSKGQLIGINFDRAYEGTMSDYLFDPSRCRNISVDIRYVLFILDKFGGAGWLADEMNIVP